MTRRLKFLLAVAGAAALVSAMPAEAQYYIQPYSQPPLYPYVVQQPNYGAVRPYPYVIERPQRHAAPHVRPSRSRTDHRAVRELRRKLSKKLPRIDKTIVVRDKPVVLENKKYVDDPPIVIQRHRMVDVPAKGKVRRSGVKRDMLTVPTNQGPAGRVIRAEAEVTIQGSDRMTIRLFRRRDGANANAKAD